MHEIIFDNVCNNWSSALPLGNGKMGAMVFFQDNALRVALNHYDCYYDVVPRYSGKTAARAKVKTYGDYRELVDNARRTENYESSHYIDTLNPAAKENRPNYSGTSYPMAGEIVISLNIQPDEFSLRLVIEQGIVLFEGKVSDRDEWVKAKIWIAKSADGLFAELSESRAGLWSGTELVKPSSIGQGRYHTEITAEGNSRLLRTKYAEKTSETAVTLTDNCIAASIFPAFNKSIAHNKELLRRKKELAEEHEKHRGELWHTTVRLPDYFLETLWHLHLYILTCASGIGGRYFEQACGLNGLWDIRRPNLWASTWYWDVNIQEAFWPVFSSNRLALGKLFCEAYLSYEESAEDFTKTHYGESGWALDYPHMLYNCIQPWCAQFLWQYYAYSGDIDMLRERIYPVFLKQIEHFKRIAEPDEHGKLHILYDISPEQGPISMDSAATVAAVKQLLKYAVKAAKVLARSAREIDEFTGLIEALPEYAKTADGSRLKDSAMAPDDLFLRHPSVLFPIFPCEEFSKNSPEDIRRTALNTLKYAAENTEIGVFGFGWLACAAAKMGEGTAALRFLYEKGLDYILHSNGLGYEESERFANHCLITKPPLYPPAMTEPSGGIVMAVNTMLLQSDDYIEVFPALPDGNDSLKTPKAQYKHQDSYLSGDYPPWNDCKFENFLAPGGFEVSAERKDGKTCWLRVVSLRGGVLNLLLPTELSSDGRAEIFTKEMSAGDEISFGAVGVKKENPQPAVQKRTAALTGRRVFLGENRHTEFYKAVDSFTCAYLLGNTHNYPMTPYVFDFGDKTTDKNYDDAYHREYCLSGKAAVFFGAPKRLGADVYSEHLGYGFASAEGLIIKDRKAPDSMRRDFVESADANEFWLELPRGKYNALLISGDEHEDSLANINLSKGKPLKAGQYQCHIMPFIHECDGLLKISLSTDEGRKWKLNALFLNKEYYF